MIGRDNLIISLPINGVSEEKVACLRKELPEAAKAAVIKKSMTHISVKESQFTPGAVSRDECMILSIPEGDAKATYDGLKKWRKEMKRTEPKFDPQFAAIEVSAYPTKNIESVQLPRTNQLLAKIAFRLEEIPDRLGWRIKAVPRRFDRAIDGIKLKLYYLVNALKSIAFDDSVGVEGPVESA